MPVETLQSGSAAAPSKGPSTAVPVAAPSRLAAGPLSFEDMVAAELGPEPAAPAGEPFRVNSLAWRTILSKLACLCPPHGGTGPIAAKKARIVPR